MRDLEKAKHLELCDLTEHFDSIFKNEMCLMINKDNNYFPKVKREAFNYICQLYMHFMENEDTFEPL